MQVEDDHRNLKQLHRDPPFQSTRCGWYQYCGLFFIAVLIVLFFIVIVLQVHALNLYASTECGYYSKFYLINNYLFFHVQLLITGNDMSDVGPKLKILEVPCKRDYLSLSDQTSDKLSSNFYGPDPTNIMEQSQVCTPTDSSLQSVVFPNTVPYHSVPDIIGIIYFLNE